MNPPGWDRYTGGVHRIRMDGRIEGRKVVMIREENLYHPHDH